MNPGSDAGTCPACGSLASRELFEVGEYGLRRCSTCGLRFVSPRPDPATLESFYGAKYFDDRGWHGGSEGDSEYVRECWASIRDRLHQRFPEGGRLLDVGTATGTMLIEASKDSWACVGLEMSAAAAERARAAGLDVRTGALDTGALDGETFDVVCSFHVIEHVLDPSADLAAMRRLVKPGGLLAIETPNARSIGYLVRGSGWVQIRPPEHIQFFDARSLARALTAAGWRPLIKWSIYRRETATRLAKERAGAFVPAARVAARVAEAFGMGGNLRMIAEAV